MDSTKYSIKKVCVFCASSSQLSRAYLEAASDLGRILAQNKISIIFGGGAIGLMGSLAESALSNYGEVIGVIPQFMVDMEWAHPGLSKLYIVHTMDERKNKMIEYSDAVIALPGGSGTLEELLVAITLKRLGLYLNPIILVNTKGFYDPLLKLLDNCIEENFMDLKHKDMWSVISSPHEVLEAIENAPKWKNEARHFAAI